MSALPTGSPLFHVTDPATGEPLAGGKVYTYAAGTTTPKTTWADAAQVSANTNPITLDANGDAKIYITGANKFIVKDSAGNTVYTIDNIIVGPDLIDGDYGDVVISGGGSMMSIDSSVITTFGRTITGAESAAASRPLILGPDVATTVDNTLPRFNGTTGALQETGVTVDDSNNVGGIATLTATAVAAGSLAASGAVTGAAAIKSTSPTAGVGYAAGAGGTVTQATSKSTGVTLNTASGQITMNNAALAAATIVSFTLTDSAIGAADILALSHVSGGTPGSYTLNAQCANGSATINVRNNTGGSLSEAIVIGFALIKGATS